MSQADLDLVRLAYDICWAARTIEPLKDRFAEGFTWQQRFEWPGRSDYGRDEMTALWADLDETYSEFELTPTDFTDCGEHVLVFVKTRARLRSSEAWVEGTLYHVWHLHDGLALGTRVFSDPSEARHAAGLPAR